ncbi:hypothetical protein MSAN_01685600 [Mycena sanguinolenta]|uniref:Secreted protein n=1 Tax=Mycena sanguinolenta TaxID=230812 RepID=A0A8H7CVK2_9AGAR|nr:hypothetical protein MSAN_01685600 [Mycena sanguinolenta]
MNQPSRGDALRATFTVCLLCLCPSGDSASDDDDTNTNTNHNGVRRVHRAHPDELEGLLDYSPSLSHLHSNLAADDARRDDRSRTRRRRSPPRRPLAALARRIFCFGALIRVGAGSARTQRRRRKREWGARTRHCVEALPLVAGASAGGVDGTAGTCSKQPRSTDDFLARVTCEGVALTQLEDRDVTSPDVVPHASPYSFPASHLSDSPSGQRQHPLEVDGYAAREEIPAPFLHLPSSSPPPADALARLQVHAAAAKNTEDEDTAVLDS